MYNLKKQNLILIALMIVLLAFSALLFSEEASAATTGKVNYSIGLNVRSGPGTSYSVITALVNGATFDIVETTTDSSGDKWYKIYVDGRYGYVFADYVIVTETPDYSYDSDFEAYLTAQGFPESYKEGLRNLHAAHPKWVFKSHKTGLSWKTVIDKESVVGRNLVHKSSPDSWKSQEYGAYDPETGKYQEYDSGGYVAASRGIIEYYMDPRNFLTEGSVFQFMAHSYDSTTQTKEGLQTLVANTFLSKTFPEKSSQYPTYADVIMYAGKNAGASPYVLASMIITEQGSDGSGGSISGKVKGYEGYYNFFNVNAYKKGNIDAVTNGLIYASGSGSYQRPWNSRVKSIIGGAIFYAEEYINNKQDTLYLKKFNVMNGSSKVATHQYMTNVRGASQEAADLKNGYSAILDVPLTFYIPVYNNMPTAACAQPGSGSNDYYLKSLSVAGYDIAPSFNMYTTDYELIVSSDASYVNIDAVANDKNAKIKGAGKVILTGDTTKATVTVTSTSGAVKKYNIVIAREKTTGVNLSSSVYKVGSYIEYVKLNTSVIEFKSNISVPSGYTFKIRKADGSELTSGNVGTGMNVVVYDKKNNPVRTIAISVKGDNSGDGKCNSLDLLNVQKHIVKMNTLSGAYFASSDINGEGKVNSLDLLNVQKHIVGISLIK